MNATAPMISCRDLHKSFGGHGVLRGVDLDFPTGEITVVLGPSGTGKSVLLKHLIGLLFPDRGDVLVGGRSLRTLKLRELLELRRRFGILFQDGALFGSMSVFDNVAFPLRQHTDMAESQIADRVRARLADVGLSDAAAQLPAQLSGGMRKRAGLARALVMEPDIVLFDEPDSGLDPVRTALLCELILAMHAEYGGTYAVITHDIALARRLSDHLALLWEGRIVEAGPSNEVFACSHPFVSQFLSGDPEGPLGMA